MVGTRLMANFGCVQVSDKYFIFRTTTSLTISKICTKLGDDEALAITFDRYWKSMERWIETIQI
jgi:hypothetical protein